MLERVRATIRKYCMFSPGDRVLAGVSGGPESVALVHVLQRLAAELQIEVNIAHLNHCFRGRESAQDAEFVRELAKQLNLPAVIESKDVTRYAREHHLSAQAAAREVRYRFFEDTARELGSSKLATGHNANDQAETVLIHFLRGSGPAGLGGIPPVRDGWIVRPLIDIQRVQIDKYCEENCLAARLDQSNLKTVYTRNKLRLELIPLLEREYNTNLVQTLVRTGEIMREEESFLQDLTSGYWHKTCVLQDKDEVAFNLRLFKELPKMIQIRLIRYAWGQLTGTGHNLGFVHLTAILNMLTGGETGSMLNLPMGVTFNRSYGQFFLSRALPPVGVQSYSHEIMIPGVTRIPETGDTILAEIMEGSIDDLSETQRFDEIVIDFDKVGQPLTVRSRKPGERFSPHGQIGTKKLKKFLIDSKVPRLDREKVPVLVTGDDQIIWVAGLRADRRWQVDRDTKKALKLKLIRNI
ncbi:MAG: tRNA lysidine(34) synthetase TilS [Eubacteriales bacterium]